MAITGNKNTHLNKPIEIICDQCGIIFRKHLCQMKKNNYCSEKCYYASLVGKKQSMETRTKRSKKLSGKLSPTWKGGNSRQYKRGYKSEQFKHWRKSVFERDNYTCQKCGQHGGYLTAHHVKSFAQYTEYRYSVDNGQTLCQICHSKTDNYRGKAKKRG